MMLGMPAHLSVAAVAGFLVLLVYSLFKTDKKPRAPESWVLESLGVEHPNFRFFFRIDGYVLGWSERWKLGREFVHLGFSNQSGGQSRFVLMLQFPYSWRKQVGMMTTNPGYTRLLHMRSIPAELKSCSAHRRVRLSGHVLKNVSGVSANDFIIANFLGGWGQDNCCPLVEISQVEFL